MVISILEDDESSLRQIALQFVDEQNNSFLPLNSLPVMVMSILLTNRHYEAHLCLLERFNCCEGLVYNFSPVISCHFFPSYNVFVSLECL